LFAEKTCGYAKRNKRKSMEKIDKCPNEKKEKGKNYIIR
jgi:hypothetical protein